MNNWFIASGGSLMTTVVMFVAMLGLLYFMMIRPAKKQQKEYSDMLSQLSVGDEVILRSGLHGLISEIDTKKNTITLDAEGIYLVFERGAIMTIVSHNNPTNSAFDDPAAEDLAGAEKDTTSSAVNAHETIAEDDEPNGDE
ncbi:MAG: preprotein translocase subunit YajC [Aerococcus sp.]|nr:preprotein translocase subunit YajC [Aerococcus sp.]